jgi:glutamine synthetase
MTKNITPSIAAGAEHENVQYIDMQFVDVMGMIKSVTIPTNRFKEVEEHRQWFDGSSIEGFARVSESDMYLKPDAETFTLIPWERDQRRSARVICDVYTPNGEPFEGDPRFVLRRLLAEAADLGLEYRVAPEVEFFLFRYDEAAQPKPEPHDTAGYFDLSPGVGYQARKDMVTDLEAMGLKVEATHHEIASGQHEIDCGAQPALKAADQIITLKWAVRAVAQRYSLRASFMPKPLFRVAGSGMHVHQSMISTKDGSNLFYNQDDTYKLSSIARHFIAGQLAHARGMCLMAAPLVNSYKRLISGFEAPIAISWARINRSALIRVPEAGTLDAKETRIELRLPDPSCNPYLAFTAMLAAGLDGINRELPLPEPVEETVFAVEAAGHTKFKLGFLPSNLEEALGELEQDDVICDVLGAHLVKQLVEAKRMEWDDYRTQVTPWEIERYLPSY